MDSMLPETKPSDNGETSARLLRVVRTLVEETHPGRTGTINPGSHLERNLGLDSLARVELLMRLENEFNTSLPEAALTEAETVRDLLRFIGATVKSENTGMPGKFVELEQETITGLPDQASTLVEVLEWHAAHHPQRTHVLLYGEEGDKGGQPQPITYAELLNDAQRIASGLIARGLLARQTVALMLPTGCSYLGSFFGVMLAGGIPVPIYPPARLAQIEDHLRRHAHILANAEAVFIITVPQAKGVAALLRAEAPSLIEIVTPEELDQPPIALRYRAAADDIAFLQYTSGSTGDPKGVVLTHANLLANLRAMGEAIAVRSDDVFVSWLPLYHDMGLIGAWFGSLYFGMLLVLMSPLAFLSRPSRWLAVISRHRGTISAAPNFAYELCAKKLADADLQGLDLSSWRLALNGAEPVSPYTLESFAARFAPCGLKREALTPVYGLAECSVGLAFPPLGRGPRIDAIVRETLVREQRAVAAGPALTDSAEVMHVPACGRALAGHEIRIVDEADGELAERRIGRLQFRGPSATRGYYRNPAATHGLFHDGWLDSGDYAYSVEGEIYLTGRVKDLIIRGGRNLYPYELEQAVGNIAGVRKGCVAVFASADPLTASERLVVLAETRVTDPKLRAALSQRINEAAVDVIGLPADEIVLAPPNSVLKTSSGKIRRAASREAYEKGTMARPPPPAWQPLLRLGLAALRARLKGWLQRAMRWIFAGWCWTIFVLFGVPVATLVTLLQSPAIGRRLVHGAARIFLALCAMPVRTTGVHKLPETAHLLLVNHSSFFDALVLFAALPPGLGYIFVAKREFVEQPAMHAFMRGLATLFVERFAAARSAEDVEEIVAALRRGEKLVIFPEGTFSREAGLKPFHMGAFVAATHAGVAVVASGLRGTRLVLRDQTWMPRFARMTLEIGEKFLPDGDDWAAAIRLRDATRSEMLRLCGEHDLQG
ncbi:AMP-binding protein [Propionivibrio sp.]|uniref:AMP-binding protein n=1 Tax=Propionivibrio sp. TaxID=2212460 RepID=UPI003BF39D7E